MSHSGRKVSHTDRQPVSLVGKSQIGRGAFPHTGPFRYPYADPFPASDAAPFNSGEGRLLCHPSCPHCHAAHTGVTKSTPRPGSHTFSPSAFTALIYTHADQAHCPYPVKQTLMHKCPRMSGFHSPHTSGFGSWSVTPADGSVSCLSMVLPSASENFAFLFSQNTVPPASETGWMTVLFLSCVSLRSVSASGLSCDLSLISRLLPQNLIKHSNSAHRNRSSAHTTW